MSAIERHIFEEFLENAPSVNSLDELNALFGASVGRLGLSTWAYQVPPKKALAEPMILHNYPKAWVERYVESRYDKIDPLVSQSSKKLLPFTWSDLLKGIELDIRQRHFFGEASDFNICEGIGFPIPSLEGKMVTLTLVPDFSAKDLPIYCASHLDKLHALALLYHSLATEFINAAAKPKKIANPISPREVECLQWLANGKSDWDISKILNISQHTVAKHLDNAKAKLGVYSRTQAVVHGIMSGIIEYEGH